MWTLKVCFLAITMMCDTTTYTQYVTLQQCKNAEEVVQKSNIDYITSCWRNE